MELLRLILWKHKARRRIERLPSVAMELVSTAHVGGFIEPSPVHDAKVYNKAGELVGAVTYAVSPLSDRIYVFGIRIESEHRRRGYGTSALWLLSQVFGQPITAVMEVFSAKAFWHAARQLEGAGLVVTEPISLGDTDLEGSRWQALKGSVAQCH
ncbi:GNAT family N-acetyltransferase [Ralstonia sp. 25C]|uniref:GNAT family N-acetyltransferase n=1 Tax=Ralstonia sp. 25C TaxID=3447363 RepID=UPI003F755E13